MKALITIFSVIILFFAGFIFYKANQFTTSSKDSTMILIPTDSCAIDKGTCIFSHSEIGNLEFSIEPLPIKINTEFELSLKTSRPGIDEVRVDFLGVDMDMGFNRPELLKTAENLFRGKGSLPACTVDRMKWQATVLLKKQGKTYGAQFYFSTVTK
ncbi:MAG: hypothetical protein H7A25_08990 [Leptospiraceae bacterium]|nr:hypothetical protein [Leptospiraceae bacterium]